CIWGPTQARRASDPTFSLGGHLAQFCRAWSTCSTFWWWAEAHLAILMVIKAVCDNVEDFKPLGELIGDCARTGDRVTRTSRDRTGPASRSAASTNPRSSRRAPARSAP